MTSVSNNVYIDKLDDIVSKCNNTHHSTVRMKPVIKHLKSNTYIDPSKEIKNKDPKFEIGDIFRISKHKNIFAKGFTPNRSEEAFLIKKGKNIVPWTYSVNDLNGGKIVETFYQKELQEQIKKSLELQK